MKKKITIISVFLVLSIMLSACGTVKVSQDKSDNNIGKEEKVSIKKDQLNIPLTRFSTLDPLENSEFTYYNFSKLIYQSLFELDTELKPVPLLVKDYSILNEGRTIEIELKEDLYWHNDDKFTTEDVKFTIEKIENLNDESIYGNMFSSAFGNFKDFNMKNIISIKIIDDTNMMIYFDESYGNNLESLTFPIVNRESYLSDDKYEPIGTGPYAYIDYNTSQGITLEKNEKYWDGEVNISKINGKVYENEESILKAFEDGRVDFAYSNGRDLKKYEDDTNIRILEYVSPEYEFLGYNFQNKLFSGEDGQAIRKAIYYGIDRQEIIREVYLCHATQVDTPIYPESYLTKKVTNTYGHNIRKSKEILREIGFENLDPNGVLKDKTGRRLSFDIVTNYSNSYRKQTAEIIKGNLEEVGIEIVLKYPHTGIETSNSDSVDLEWEELNEILRDGKYDLAVLGWEISELTDISFMFHSSFIYTGSNFIFYKDSTMDSLLESIYINTIDGKIEKYVDLQEKIMEDLPYASLFFRNKGLLLKENIEGDFNPTFFNLFRGIEKYDLLED